ncbi:MAG: hypothetical protein M1828_001214 [Chrysothrix sp. TS-e1954]|nr:MAG: hypothetical protein M1828_001214 [Chrysothrix sp. TS-e1954]
MSDNQTSSDPRNAQSRPFSYQIAANQSTSRAAHQSSTQQQSGSRERPFSYQIPPDENATLSRPPENVTRQESNQQPRLSLQTGNGQGRAWAGFPEQRFSVIETPIEDSTQIFDEAPEEQAAIGQQEASVGGQAVAQSRPTDIAPPPQYPAEKSDVQRIPSAYQSPPPTELHPALAAAAYTSNDTQIPPQFQQQPYLPQSRSPPPVPLSPDLIKPALTPPPNSSNAPASRNTALAIQPVTADPPTFAPPPTPGRTKSATATSFGPTNSSTLWSQTLCACPPSDLSTCCLGLFCPCIVYSRTMHRLSNRKKHNGEAGAGNNLLGWSACDGPCLGFALLCGCQGVLATILRTRVRRTYGIHGGVMDDAVVGCCCCCCTVVQGEREVRAREDEGGYKSVPGMRYGPESHEPSSTGTRMA